jgi:hypothetical protein
MAEVKVILRPLRFHHLIIPIAAAMVAIGLALIAAPISFAETLGLDLVSAIGSVLIVFGVFCIASYVVVRAIEWADRLSHEGHKEAPSKEE